MPYEKAIKKITNSNELPEDLTPEIDTLAGEMPIETATIEQNPSNSSPEQNTDNAIVVEKKAKLRASRKKLEKEAMDEIRTSIDAKFDKFYNPELKHESLEQKITTEIFDENQAKDIAKQINAGITLNALQRAIYEKTKDMVDPMLQNKKESNWGKIKKIIIDKIFNKK